MFQKRHITSVYEVNFTSSHLELNSGDLPIIVLCLTKGTSKHYKYESVLELLLHLECFTFDICSTLCLRLGAPQYLLGTQYLRQMFQNYLQLIGGKIRVMGVRVLRNATQIHLTIHKAGSNMSPQWFWNAAHQCLGCIYLASQTCVRTQPTE